MIFSSLQISKHVKFIPKIVKEKNRHLLTTKQKMPFFNFSNPTPIIAVVQTAENELKWEVDSKIKVKDLIQMVCNDLTLRESCYFGLCQPPKKVSCSNSGSQMNLDQIQTIQNNNFNKNNNNIQNPEYLNNNVLNNIESATTCESACNENNSNNNNGSIRNAKNLSQSNHNLKTSMGSNLDNVGGNGVNLNNVNLQRSSSSVYRFGRYFLNHFFGPEKDQPFFINH